MKMFPLRVNDLKQFAYCPRIVYFQYVMPVKGRATYKMEHGKVSEARIGELEKRRKLQRYGIDVGRREFRKTILSERLGLSGVLDMLITLDKSAADGFSGMEMIPVDFKHTLGRPQQNHHFQLCGYALLLEDVCGGVVSRGFVYLIPRNEAVVVEMTDELRSETIGNLGEMREMVVSQRFPGPAKQAAKCLECEYRNYCGDVC